MEIQETSLCWLGGGGVKGHQNFVHKWAFPPNFGLF